MKLPFSTSTIKKLLLCAALTSLTPLIHADDAIDQIENESTKALLLTALPPQKLTRSQRLARWFARHKGLLIGTSTGIVLSALATYLIMRERAGAPVAPVAPRKPQMAVASTNTEDVVEVGLDAALPPETPARTKEEREQFDQHMASLQNTVTRLEKLKGAGKKEDRAEIVRLGAELKQQMTELLTMRGADQKLIEQLQKQIASSHAALHNAQAQHRTSLETAMTSHGQAMKELAEKHAAAVAAAGERERGLVQQVQQVQASFEAERKRQSTEYEQQLREQSEKTAAERESLMRELKEAQAAGSERSTDAAKLLNLLEKQRESHEQWRSDFDARAAAAAEQSARKHEEATRQLSKQVEQASEARAQAELKHAEEFASIKAAVETAKTELLTGQGEVKTHVTEQADATRSHMTTELEEQLTTSLQPMTTLLNELKAQTSPTTVQQAFVSVVELRMRNMASQIAEAVKRRDAAKEQAMLSKIKAETQSAMSPVRMSMQTATKRLRLAEIELQKANRLVEQDSRAVADLMKMHKEQETHQQAIIASLGMQASRQNAATQRMFRNLKAGQRKAIAAIGKASSKEDIANLTAQARIQNELLTRVDSAKATSARVQTELKELVENARTAATESRKVLQDTLSRKMDEMSRTQGEQLAALTRATGDTSGLADVIAEAIEPLKAHVTSETLTAGKVSAAQHGRLSRSLRKLTGLYTALAQDSHKLARESHELAQKSHTSQHEQFKTNYATQRMLLSSGVAERKQLNTRIKELEATIARLAERPAAEASDEGIAAVSHQIEQVLNAVQQLGQSGAGAGISAGHSLDTDVGGELDLEAIMAEMQEYLSSSPESLNSPSKQPTVLPGTGGSPGGKPLSSAGRPRSGSVVPTSSSKSKSSNPPANRSKSAVQQRKGAQRQALAPINGTNGSVP